MNSDRARGALLGTATGDALGAEALPSEWTRMLHEWPGLGGEELADHAGAVIGPDQAGST